jgi:hypothetical protein
LLRVLASLPFSLASCSSLSLACCACPLALAFDHHVALIPSPCAALEVPPPPLRARASPHRMSASLSQSRSTCGDAASCVAARTSGERWKCGVMCRRTRPPRGMGRRRAALSSLLRGRPGAVPAPGAPQRQSCAGRRRAQLRRGRHDDGEVAAGLP